MPRLPMKFQNTETCKKDYLFKVTNELACGYGKKVVLRLNDLEIPRNKFVFVLGISGSGKSTMIELLGLMRNSLISGSFNFKPSKNEDSYIIDQSFLSSKNDRLANIRKSFFSFIFQENYLVNEYTFKENAEITSLIKGQIENETLIQYIEDLKLSNKINTSISRASVGQRQRVALIQALLPAYEVLFCDEPTGNLDPFMANKVMTKLQNAVSYMGKSLIMVSHSISNAREYADIIYILTPVKDGDNIVFQPKKIFEKGDPDPEQEIMVHFKKSYETIDK